MKVDIRKWRSEDLSTLVRYANNKNIADNMADGFPSPFTEESGRKFLQRAAVEPTRMFAITFDEAVVGSIGIFPDDDIHRKNAAIAYWLAEPFWNKGIMPAAIAKIVTYGFETFDITRIYAKPYSTNIGSCRVLEKCGFTLDAVIKDGVFKNGKYLDEMIYAVRLVRAKA